MLPGRISRSQTVTGQRFDEVQAAALPAIPIPITAARIPHPLVDVRDTVQ
jgi:hypothetical protein